MDDDELDARIEEWHSLPENGVPLHEYLGMTFYEYADRLGMDTRSTQKVLDILSTMGQPIQPPVKDPKALRMLQDLRDDHTLRSEWIEVTSGAATFTQTLLKLVEMVNQLQGQVQDLQWDVEALKSHDHSDA